MVEESNQNALLNQSDAPRFAELEISEFEISRFDCIFDIYRVRTKFTELHFDISRCISKSSLMTFVTKVERYIMYYLSPFSKPQCAIYKHIGTAWDAEWDAE